MSPSTGGRPGSTPQIEASVTKGLEFLARRQDRDGSWSEGTGYGSNPVAMTSLAGSGSSPTRGKYWSNVRKATRFLRNCAGTDGLITSRGEGRHIYGHGFATMFLSQVYGMELDAQMQKKLHKILSKSVGLICRAQSTEGGWYYYANSGREEGSVAITQVPALRACRNAGILVPKKTIDRAVNYISRLANKDGGISYSLNQRNSQPAITAAAVAVLYNAGNYDDPIAAKALAFAVRHLSTDGSGNGHHYYAQLYLSQALYQEAKKRWGQHYQKISTWLRRHQKTDGSWMGDTVGHVYGTALALTILPLPYSLVPPLVLDTTLVTNPGHHGFEFWDDGAAPPGITSVVLVDEDTVKIQLASVPAGVVQRVRYAYTGIADARARPTTGPRGNLRDSDANGSRHGSPLYNWAVHFDLPVK